MRAGSSEACDMRLPSRAAHGCHRSLPSHAAHGDGPMLIWLHKRALQLLHLFGIPGAAPPASVHRAFCSVDESLRNSKKECLR